MNIIILTSAEKGIASHHISCLLGKPGINIVSVVLSEGGNKNKYKLIKKKLKKIFQIGLLGALNGIRIRRWFADDIYYRLNTESLETLCKRHDIPFHTTPYINSTVTMDLFKKANADLGVSLGNGYIGQRIFNIPKYGMINIHHELLPDFQNAQSVIWQLFRKSRNTGYTIHKIDKHIDTGDVLLKEIIPISFQKTLRKTVSYTTELLFHASAKGLASVLNNFEQYNPYDLE